MYEVVFVEIDAEDRVYVCSGASKSLKRAIRNAVKSLRKQRYVGGYNVMQLCAIDIFKNGVRIKSEIQQFYGCNMQYLPSNNDMMADIRHEVRIARWAIQA